MHTYSDDSGGTLGYTSLSDPHHTGKQLQWSSTSSSVLFRGTVSLMATWVPLRTHTKGWQ